MILSLGIARTLHSPVQPRFCPELGLEGIDFSWRQPVRRVFSAHGGSGHLVFSWIPATRPI